MPVIRGGYFGEDGNNDEGLHRVIYSYKSGDADTAGHPLGYYCSTIYHTGFDNAFSRCDVVKA